MSTPASPRFRSVVPLFLFFSFLQQPDAAFAQSCSDLASVYINWIKLKPGIGDGFHAVGAKMADVKIKEKNPDIYPWGYGAYAESRLGLAGDQLTGRFITLFSDRKSPDGQYRFAPEKSDIRDVTLFADGSVKVVLVSWGSATFFLENVQCYPDGFLTGIMREANGVSMVSLALRQEVMHPDRDGFGDWPRASWKWFVVEPFRFAAPE